MYKKLTQIHLNYKFKKITFKNFQIHGLSDCLAKGVKILDGMKCSPLLAPVPLDTWKFEMQLRSGIIIVLFLLSHNFLLTQFFGVSWVITLGKYVSRPPRV